VAPNCNERAGNSLEMGLQSRDSEKESEAQICTTQSAQSEHQILEKTGASAERRAPRRAVTER
jgi:hypothetical protein